MEIKYAAEFSYGKPSMAIVKIERETAKTYFVADKETLMGWISLPKQLRKDGKTKVFDTALEAVTWLYWKARDRANSMKEEWEALKETISDLEKVIEEVKEDAQK